MAGYTSSVLLLIFFSVSDVFANEIYTNVWAVKIRGGQREVENLVFKYGFVYDRHVSTASFCQRFARL